MQRIFTGIKDVDREILMKLDDKSLLEACIINKYMRTEVCNDSFLIKRMLKNYPGAIKYKPHDKSWRKYFLETIYFTDKMKNEFDYDYVFGNPQKQYDILKIFAEFKFYFEPIIIRSIHEKENALAIYYLKKSPLNDTIIQHLIIFGDLDILKYAFENIPNFKKNYGELSMSLSLETSNIEKFTYLLSMGILPPPGIFPKLNLSNEKFIKFLIDTGLFKNEYQEAIKILTAYTKIENPLYVRVLKYLLDNGGTLPKDVSKKFLKNYNKMLKYLEQQSKSKNPKNV